MEAKQAGMAALEDHPAFEVGHRGGAVDDQAIDLADLALYSAGLIDRPEMRAVLAEPDLVTRLARFADVNTAVMRRTAQLLRALRGAAASEPVAAALVAQADGARLEAMGVHAAAAARGDSPSSRRNAATCCGPRPTGRSGTAW
jgi:hypothetical protein